LETSFCGFSVYLLQKFDDFLASFRFLLFGNRVFGGTKRVNDYAFVLVKHYRVYSASQRTIFAFSANPLCRVKENADSALIAQDSVTFLVKVHEEISPEAFSLQTFNILVREQHLCFFAAFATAQTTHTRYSCSAGISAYRQKACGFSTRGFKELKI
jgi:hypothetical protein